MLAGDITLSTRPARLVMRYERDALRQFRESMTVLQARDLDVAAQAGPVAKLPPPTRIAPPVKIEPAMPRAPEPTRPIPALVDAGPAWLDEMERRIGWEAMDARQARSVADLDRLAASRPDLAPTRPVAARRCQSPGRPPLVGRNGQPIA